MKTLFEAIGTTIKAFLLWIYIVLVGTIFVFVPVGALALIAWIFIKIFTL